MNCALCFWLVQLLQLMQATLIDSRVAVDREQQQLLGTKVVDDGVLGRNEESVFFTQWDSPPFHFVRSKTSLKEAIEEMKEESIYVGDMLLMHRFKVQFKSPLQEFTF